MKTWLVGIMVALLTAGSVFGAIGTVTLKSGLQYKDVTYIVDTMGKALIIPQSGGVLKVLPEQIEQVMDRDRGNITAEIFAALRYTPGSDTLQVVPPDTARPVSPVMAKPVAPPSPSRVTTSSPRSTNRPLRTFGHGVAKPFEMAFGFRGIYSVPFGQYYEGFTGGVGFEADLQIMINPENSLMFLVSQSGIRMSNSWFSNLVEYPYIIDDMNISTTVTRYYIGLAQTRNAGGRPDQPNLWYVYVVVGAVAHKIDGRFDVIDSHTQERATATISPFSDTRFAQAIGAGYIARLSKTLGLNLSGSLEGVWTRVIDRYTGDESVAIKGFTFDLKAGFSLLLGN